jgi:predicted DNA-binding antitoxin AbrB/MazE fold protein
VGKTVEAIYEHGVLRPLENPGLADGQHVRVTIADSVMLADVADSFEPAEWAAALQDDISLETVRRALSGIRGSLSDAVIASREERRS